MTVSAIFILLASVAQAARQEEGAFEHDGSFSKMPKPKIYATLEALLINYPVVQQGELVDIEACSIKVAPPQKPDAIILSRHGFTMFIPKPEAILAALIKDMPIVFTGNAKRNIKEKHAAMLKKMLPAVGNHQLLARALANPKFKFVIDYSNGLDRGMNGVFGPGPHGLTLVRHMLIVLKETLFNDESNLLRLVKNEFASMNTLTANICRWETYDSSTTRISPFTLYSNSQKTPDILDDHNLSPEMHKFLIDMQKSYHDFIASKNLFLAMSEGKVEKTEKYEQLEAHLLNFIPSPMILSWSNGFADARLTSENKLAADEYFDIYDLRKSGSTLLYIPRNSYHKDHGGTSFEAFIFDPRALTGKLNLLYKNLIDDREMTIESKNALYASGSSMERYAEWLSFLEDKLSPAFLQFLFPSYCEYMTAYTQLDQDERDYCKP